MDKMGRCLIVITEFFSVALLYMCLVILPTAAQDASASSLGAQDASEPPESPPSDEGASASPPDGLDPQLVSEFGLEALIGNPPTDISASVGAETPPVPAGADRYLSSTLRVVNSGSPRGCSYANWACMTNLCKSDLGSAAWRGWAGCQKSGSSWICYFECGLVRNSF